MGLAKVLSSAIRGLDGSLVEVEVDVSNRLPGFFVVGLPDATVSEARERVRSAVRNSGGIFPIKRVVVSLAPADLKKESTAYGLPIAVGVLVATGQVTADLDATVLLRAATASRRCPTGSTSSRRRNRPGGMPICRR